MNKLIDQVIHQLLPKLQMRSVNPHEPVEIGHLPHPWRLLGTGNYAGVFLHPEYPHLVVKIYAPGRPGIAEEKWVYSKLGVHPSYSQCYYEGDQFIILKRLTGITLYDCVHRGIPIPEKVILDIDKALAYARKVGLYPHDVHGKNVMMQDGCGLVVDVSDFYKEGICKKWKHLKKAYYKIYLPILYRFPVPIPYFILNLVRKSYRLYTGYVSSKEAMQPPWT